MELEDFSVEHLLVLHETAKQVYLQPLGPGWDADDRRWAYKSMMRIQHRLRAFDVVV